MRILTKNKVKKLCKCHCHWDEPYAYCIVCYENKCEAYKYLRTYNINKMITLSDNCYLCSNKLKTYSPGICFDCEKLAKKLKPNEKVILERTKNKKEFKIGRFIIYF